MSRIFLLSSNFRIYQKMNIGVGDRVKSIKFTPFQEKHGVKRDVIYTVQYVYCDEDITLEEFPGIAFEGWNFTKVDNILNINIEKDLKI